MYNFNHLYYFYIVAKSGGVTIASKYLRISQPSLSSQLKVLEHSLGFRLFKKVGRHNQLTQSGTVIYSYCRKMFELSEQMNELISNNSPMIERKIKIGVADSVDRNFLIEVISDFLKKQPAGARSSISVHSGSQEELTELLRLHELDVVLTDQALHSRDMIVLARLNMPMTVICSSANEKQFLAVSQPEQCNSGDPFSSFRGLNTLWALPSYKFKFRLDIDRFFEANSFKGRVVAESDLMGAIVRMVIDEVAISLLPIIYVAKEIREMSLVMLGPKDAYWDYNLWLSCHGQSKNDFLTPLTQSFKEVFQSESLVSA